MFSNIPPLSSGSGFRQMAESQLTKPIDEARFRQLAGSQEAKPAPELPLATLAGPRVPSVLPGRTLGGLTPVILDVRPIRR